MEPICIISNFVWLCNEGTIIGAQRVTEAHKYSKMYIFYSQFMNIITAFLFFLIKLKPKITNQMLKHGENHFMKTNIESLIFQLICDFALHSVVCPILLLVFAIKLQTPFMNIKRTSISNYSVLHCPITFSSCLQL